MKMTKSKHQLATAGESYSYAWVPTGNDAIGSVLVVADDEGVVAANVSSSEHFLEPQASWKGYQPSDDIKNPHLSKAVDYLQRYFAGERPDFNEISFHLKGTEFQKTVWRGLCKVPYGSLWSYGKLAAQVGSPKGARAIGLANGRNPICILVPCHRVVGRDSMLVGYSGGMHIKRFLLALEGWRLDDSRVLARKDDIMPSDCDIVLRTSSASSKTSAPKRKQANELEKLAFAGYMRKTSRVE